MSLHHRAVITGWGFSPTLGCDIAKSTFDVGFPWGTSWKESENVMRTVRSLEERGMRVTVETRDAG